MVNNTCFREEPCLISILTSETVLIPGHVVTTEALQRLCITHVQTKIMYENKNERIPIKMMIKNSIHENRHQQCKPRITRGQKIGSMGKRDTLICLP